MTVLGKERIGRQIFYVALVSLPYKSIYRFYHRQGFVIVKKYRKDALEKFGKDFFSDKYIIKHFKNE